MSEKWNGIVRYQGRGGRGRGRANRGNIYSGATTKNMGLCDDLGNHIFNYIQKEISDQIINRWDKIVHHVGKIHGQNISNTLQNKKTVIITKPQHTQYV